MKPLPRAEKDIIADGNPIRFSGVTQDITQQKELLSSLQIQSLVFQRMDEGVSVSDDNGFIVLTNPAEDKMFGYEAGELIGRHVTIQNAYAPEENEKIVESVIAELKVKGFWSGEWHNRKKDGTDFYTYSYITSVPVDGKALFVCVQRDITEEKKNKEALKQSEERFQGAVAAVQGILWTNNARGEMEGPQPGWAALTGQTYEEYQGYGWSKAVHPDDAQPTIDAWNQSVSERKTFIFEHRVRMINGAWGLFSIRAIPLFNLAGDIREWVGVHTNITGQRQVQQDLKQSEERFRSLANSIPQLAWMTDAEGWIYWYNQRWYDYTGTVFDEMKGWGWQAVHHPDLLAPMVERFKKAIASGEPWEDTFLLRGKDGIYRWFLSRALPIRNENGEIVQWFGTNTDISEQRKTEEDLKKIKDQLELTFRNVSSAIYHFDKSGKILYLNEKGARQMGYETVEGVLAEKDVFQFRKKLDETFDVLDEEGKPLPLDKSSAALAFSTGKSSEVITKFIHRNTGASFWLLSKSAPLYDENGELFMVLTTATDITLQKTSEQTIRQSEEKFRTLAETLPQLVWITNETGEQEYASNRWKEYTGIEPTGSGSWQQMVHPDDMPVITNAWMNSMARGELYRSEGRLKSKTGEYRWHSVQGEPIRNESGVIIKWIGSFTDIHDQKTIAVKLEQLVAKRTAELKKSNEDLEQFAHVASHDLKEPLRKVKTFGSRLMEEYGDGLNEKAKTYIDKMQTAATRMYDMIDGVLLYSSMNETEQVADKIDLNEILKNIEKDLEIVIQQKKAVIQYQNLPTIEGSAVLIHQLFYNLISNSLKFSKGNTYPVIELSSKTIKGKELKNRINAPVSEKYFKIAIKDNGIGFNQRQAEKIFKTFTRLNSKDKYDGTGLGLALCKKIAERHHGSIYAEGIEEKGATFYVLLPVI